MLTWCLPSETITRPPTTTVRTSAEVAAITTCSGSEPEVLTESRSTATRSHGAPTAIRPAVGPSQGAMAVLARYPDQLIGREQTAGLFLETLIHLDPRISSKASMATCWSVPSEIGTPA